jgi:site-specific DNA recombinase
MAALQRQLQLSIELDRMLAAIRAGLDPELAAAETRRMQADLASASATVSGWERSNQTGTALTADQVRAAITESGDLVGLLRIASRTDRAQLYRALGVQLEYEKEAATGVERVHVRSLLSSSGGRI